MSDKEKNNDIIPLFVLWRSSLEVNSMVAGPEVYVCDRCVEDASSIIKSDLASLAKRREKSIQPVLSPLKLRQNSMNMLLDKNLPKKR